MPDVRSTTPFGGTQGPLAVIGWGAYLACSWTWCIGMFLPVLLLRDYGVWGFVVFAVPNVVGAGAMGWVLRKPGAAAAILERHRFACAVFSAVTVLFQVSFLCAVSALDGPAWWIAVCAGSFVVSILAASGKWPGVLVSVMVWALSAAAALVLWQGGHLAFGLPPDVGAQNPSGVMWLAPVCIFGFMLCPYLDATFLMARAQTESRTGIAAFIFGFGVLFFAMILFTAGYARFFLGTDVVPGSTSADAAVLSLLLAHIGVQAAFTITVHTGYWAVRSHPLIKSLDPVKASLLAVPVTLVMLALGLLPLVGAAVHYSRHLPVSPLEVSYRMYMAYYGLVFPAYVWLCMIPTSDGHSGTDGPRGRLKLAVLAAAVALAAPCYWMGFIEREEWWLVPGLGVVLASRLLVRGARAGSTLRVPP